MTLERSKIMSEQTKCPTIDELFAYVNGELKNHQERSFSIEKHIYGQNEEGRSKRCKACLKHVASFNGASETLINSIEYL